MLRHFFIAVDDPLHREPAALQVLGAKEIPILVGQGLPVDFGIISDTKRIQPVEEEQVAVE